MMLFILSMNTYCLLFLDALKYIKRHLLCDKWLTMRNQSYQDQKGWLIVFNQSRFSFFRVDEFVKFDEKL